MNIVDCIRERANQRPEHPALVVEREGEDTRVGYAELVGNAEAHAKRLRDAGVARGDRCGLVAAQGPGFVELALGILAADACLVPISDDHRGALFDAFAARAHLHHALTETEAEPQLASFPDVSPVDGAHDARFRALGPAYLRFTSGTTSARKGVILGHARVLERTAAANRALGIGPEDRVLWLLPMAHHFVVSILLYLRFGATVLLPARALARPILEFAARARATVLYASPHHYALLAKDASDAALGGVRLAISTADGMRPEVARRFAERFGLPVAQALGIIEVGLPVMNLARSGEKPGALGQPLPDYDVWLRAEDGQRIEGPGDPQHTGEVCVRGPGLLDAYLEPWLESDELLAPDGFRTGDQGYWDADGDLHLAGRRANRISMAGMKFFGEEVEAVLDAHPAVRESRVFAREHAHLGEIPVAEIVAADPDAPPAARDLSAHCRGRLPGYKIPRAFTVVDALERTSTGKLRRA